MGFPLTIGLTLGGLAIALFCAWMGARPVRLMGPPRLVPWRILMMFAFVFVIACLVHVVSLVRHT